MDGWMEILRKQAAIAPSLHHSWSGSSSPTATTAVSGSCNSRQCRPPLLVLPRITFVPQCRALASGLERKQTLCRCSSNSVGDGLTRVYNHAQQFASCRGGRELSKAESRGSFYGIHHAPIIKVGAFRERFELVCRVIHFIKCSGPRRPVAKSSLNSGFSNGESNADLELELFRFMQQSSKPDAFPTRQELISAGRLDLAMAIDQEGGWLAADWDEVETSSTDLSGENLGTVGKGSATARREKGSSCKRSSRKFKPHSAKRSSTARNSSRMATLAIDERTNEIEGLVNVSSVVREVVNAEDHKDGRKKDNERTMLDTDSELFENFSIMERAGLPFEGESAVHEWKPSSRPSNDDLEVLERLESLFNFTEELKLKRPLKGYTWAQDSARNGFVNGTIETTNPTKFFNENSFQTETNGQGPAENSLLDAKALQSGSEELRKTGNADDEEHHGARSEFIDAEDTLEFRENSIMHARNELNTTRAQVAAVEGNLKVEIMEARKILEEKSRELERARSISQHLRTARIVWPNYANEVYVTGSFNGWNSQVKMEKSSAGVFTCSLPLYPGKYEIKFIVDGSWRVDTQRPIVYLGGFENNVLTVS